MGAIDPTTVITPEYLGAQQTRLTRFCYALTGDRQAVPDLVQETNFEAWRSRHQMHTPQACDQWLMGIARNVCRRWIKQQAQKRAMMYQAPTTELLLDQAVAPSSLSGPLQSVLEGLDPYTTEILWLRFVEGYTVAEISDRTGLSVAAVTKRLQRAKFRARRHLMDYGPRFAQTHRGHESTEESDWELTSLWCPFCGRRRLYGRTTQADPLQLDCIGCEGVRPWGRTRSAVTRTMNWLRPANLFDGVIGYPDALEQLFGADQELVSRGIADLNLICPECGMEVRARADAEQETAGEYFVGAECPACSTTVYHSPFCWLALGTHIGRQFWADNPRIQLLPSRIVEAEVGEAVITRFHSLDNSTKLVAVFSRVNGTMLHVGVERGA